MSHLSSLCVTGASLTNGETKGLLGTPCLCQGRTHQPCTEGHAGIYMQVRPASCALRTYSREQIQGYILSPKCQGWRCIQGLSKTAPFPTSTTTTQQPNTPTLAGQDVAVSKSYMEEGLFARQHKPTNREPIPWSWSRELEARARLQQSPQQIIVKCRERGMKALLELASLFQVIPKASQAPWQGGRGGQREWEKRPLSTPFCVSQHQRQLTVVGIHTD